MEKMIEKFKQGTRYVNIAAVVTENELTVPFACNDDYLNLDCIKFIPASGAATRMFKDLYQYLEDGIETDFILRFFENISRFAFFNDLQKSFKDMPLDLTRPDGKRKVVEMLLTDGLNYGNLPKALLKVHAYQEKTVTPIDEHIFEGQAYAGREAVKLHFTISKEHQDLFDDYVKGALDGQGNISISHSFQKKVTDTVAVDMDNQPFLDEAGEILYRAGGHGALIENLNDLDAEIVFIKNIDNVCHRNHVQETIDYKKTLASVGLDIKQTIDTYIKAILAGEADLKRVQLFIEMTLNIKCKKEMTKEQALFFLDRPLRVCGVVKNQGEPGGGPFIVDNGEYLDLQICEMSEIDLNKPENKALIGTSQFFNPVDLVCFIKDYKGDKFNLLDYTNPDRYFISEKSYHGRKLKALEHPGLWNGAMHNWNTLFVEVPLATFNPIKTVNDLLRPGHNR